MIEGDYYFNDTLKYEVENWDYLTEDRDRRFFYERTEGFDPYSLKRPLPEIPEGTYGNSVVCCTRINNLIVDVGDGYYEPVASIIYTYEGQVLRTPSEKEVIIVFFMQIMRERRDRLNGRLRSADIIQERKECLEEYLFMNWLKLIELTRRTIKS